MKAHIFQSNLREHLDLFQALGPLGADIERAGTLMAEALGGPVEVVGIEREPAYAAVARERE